MITLNQAIDIVQSQVFTIAEEEKVNLGESLGRVLAQDVVSDMNMPPFDKTAVDGYACKMADCKGELEVIEIIPAGSIPQKTVGKGQCSKIMTGAMIPQGADCVIMVEDTKVVSENRVVFTGGMPRPNICRLGEDMRTGDVAITKGTTISKQHIAIMAALGCHQPVVFRKPSIAVLVTGDELVEPNVIPQAGQIRNSNGHQLIAQIINTNAQPSYTGIVRDTEEATHKALSDALDNNDIVILTGGVSMGDYDYVPAVMKKLGVQILFDSIAIQPGKPTKFGVKDGKLIFGLPGNPVSSYLQFEILIKPAIRKMMGSLKDSEFIARMPLASNYTRKKTERLGIIPVSVTKDNKANPVEFHGSAHIFALAHADGYIMIPIGASALNEGDLVDVRPL